MAARSTSSTEWNADQCRELLLHAVWPMFLWDPDSGVILESNLAASTRYGYSREEFAELRVKDIVSAQARPAFEQLLHPALEPPSLDLTTEHVLASGDLLPVVVTSFPVTWKGRPARFSIVRDRRPAVDLMQQTARINDLENMARISAAIAHNFNNLLTVIQASAESLQEHVSEPMAQQAEMIATTATAANRLAQQLLRFGHRQPGRVFPADMAELTRDEFAILVAACGPEVELRVETEDATWVNVDAEQYREALLNLVVNACEAMDGRGACTIGVAHRELKENRPDLDLSAGSYVLVSVKDGGRGMDAQTLGRALEPYFSTKQTGHGLGLASVYGIMRLHRGAVEILSEEGVGSEVRLYFPAATPAIDTASIPG